MRSGLRKLSWGVTGVVALLLLMMAIAYSLMDGSLAKLSGEQPLQGLREPVTVGRDALGVPVIRARDPLDAVRAQGFVHAQERFFQMDLMRRSAAGELSELFGAVALSADKSARLHRFRHRAGETLQRLPADQRALLEAYTDGVNQGMAALTRKPFEYYVLRSDPLAWRPEDSLLCGFAMYFTLQNAEGGIELARLAAREALPAALFDWLTPRGSRFDAPLFGEAFTPPALPGAASLQGWAPAPVSAVWPEALDEALFPGSNSWAVSGANSAHGVAMLANDMHLGIRVPNTWFRAQLWYADGDREQKITGVTLPGMPGVVVGSNGHIAWGFTNSYGDWADVVQLELIDEQRYRTSEGDKTLQGFDEAIAVKGESPVMLKVEESVWGPVIRRDEDGRAFVLRWVAHDPLQGMNLGLLNVAKARSVLEALDAAKHARIPAQNFLVVDRDGQIAWTIIGAIPRRVGHEGRDVTASTDGSKGWDGFLSPEEYPEVLNPLDGRLWTANNRIASDEALQKIGDGGYDFGARGQQIRDRLRERAQFSESDLLAIQLDSDARYLTHWQQRLLGVLDGEALKGNAGRAAFRQEVENWGSKAAVDSAGYRFVRGYRLLLKDVLYRSWLGEKLSQDKRFNPRHLSSHWEAPVWDAISQQPVHMLPPSWKDWRSLELAVVDELIAFYQRKKGGMEKRTWGERNSVKIQHPLSRAIPFSSWLLDAPVLPLAGDSNLPRVQSGTLGASERLVVAPGKEEQGYFHMPTGQSGHPLSPFYMAGHQAWVNGEATPFLPGTAVYTLTLKPIVE